MAMVAPNADIPTDLVDCLGCKSPRDALLALAQDSEQTAAKLAEELALSLSGDNAARSGSGGGGKHHAGTPLSKRKSKLGTDDHDKDNVWRTGGRGAFPVPLPKSLRDAPRPPAPAASDPADAADDAVDGNPPPVAATPSRTMHQSNPSHPLTLAAIATESILSSLSKVASGGSAASSEMRALERQRQVLDAEARDLEDALTIREGHVRGGDSLLGRRYADAARAVADVETVLGGGGDRDPATARARELAGTEALSGHARTAEVLKRAVGERYETAVQTGDVTGLSELTPLLKMLGMAELGVRLYLQYSQACLCKAMASETPEGAVIPAEVALDMTGVPREEGMSRAAMRRREEERLRREAHDQSVPSRLARIYNAAVTHLRHHLPMVAYALGEADGDAALVQLVHVEAERRAVDILRECMAERELGRTVRRAEAVAAKVEERYAGGGAEGGSEGAGLFGTDGENIASAIMGLGGDASSSDPADIVAQRSAAQRDDCGFTIEVGNLADVDAALEEWALVMQHTESYERFVRHAAAEVIRARRLRREQKREEARRRQEREEAQCQDGNTAESALLVSALATPRQKLSEQGDEEDEEERIEILPPRTALNEVIAEISGYYCSLERCLLLAEVQRAFIHANFPDESTFTPLSIGNTHDTRALQTNLVEECLFAARRSTLRAFATGHTGTASAAANVCVDVLGRVLLEVLGRRAGLSSDLVVPGPDRALGQAALSFARGAAGKGLRGVQGAAARAGGAARDGETTEEARRQAELGAARAAASFNDLEVAADYTRRLEKHLLTEVDAGFPPQDQATEQLRLCARGLGGVAESFTMSSTRNIEGLVGMLLPRARRIADNAVGLGEGSGGTSKGAAHQAASNFLGSPVLTVGHAATAAVALDYNLDEAAFELAQISEGYMGSMCLSLDELIEPLRMHLVPNLADKFLIGILGGVSKRLELAIRKSKFTPLGAISLDSDIRYIMNFAKDRINSPQLKSNVTLCRACPPLARLNQITLLMNVDDLEDALDLITISKRKGTWDLKLDDAKTLLSMRVDFEGSQVNDLLTIDEE